MFHSFLTKALLNPLKNQKPIKISSSFEGFNGLWIIRVDLIYNAIYASKVEILGEEEKTIVVTTLKQFYKNRADEVVDSLIKKLRKGTSLSSNELKKYIELVEAAYKEIGNNIAVSLGEVLKNVKVMENLNKTLMEMLLQDLDIIKQVSSDIGHLDNLLEYITAYKEASAINGWRSKMEENILKSKEIRLGNGTLLEEIKI